MASNYSILPKVLQHVKKSLYNQPKPYFFKKLLWSHFWIDFNKCLYFDCLFAHYVYDAFSINWYSWKKNLSFPFVQFSRLHAEHKLVQNTIGTLIFFYLSLFVCLFLFLFYLFVRIFCFFVSVLLFIHERWCRVCLVF
jgi:hypothetical protein